MFSDPSRIGLNAAQGEEMHLFDAEQRVCRLMRRQFRGKFGRLVWQQ